MLIFNIPNLLKSLMKMLCIKKFEFKILSPRNNNCLFFFKYFRFKTILVKSHTYFITICDEIIVHIYI